jgi:hypothetical protein
MNVVSGSLISSPRTNQSREVTMPERGYYDDEYGDTLCAREQCLDGYSDVRAFELYGPDGIMTNRLVLITDVDLKNGEFDPDSECYECGRAIFDD